MPTLGTQTISSSYPQLLKTNLTTGLDGTLQVITDGDNTSSALYLSTTGVKSVGTLAVDGTSLLTGAVTFGTGFTASSGTATLGTVSISTATISTATISTATFSTATIPTILGATTFGSSITASTGTATIGTLRIGAGSNLTAISYGTAAFTLSTLTDIDHITNGLNITTGTFALANCVATDMLIGSINSLGSVTGGSYSQLMTDFKVESAGVARFTVFNTAQTNSTIPAGVVAATALRFA